MIHKKTIKQNKRNKKGINKNSKRSKSKKGGWFGLFDKPDNTQLCNDNDLNYESNLSDKINFFENKYKNCCSPKGSMWGKITQREKMNQDRKNNSSYCTSIEQKLNNLYSENIKNEKIQQYYGSNTNLGEIYENESDNMCKSDHYWDTESSSGVTDRFRACCLNTSNQNADSRTFCNELKTQQSALIREEREKATDVMNSVIPNQKINCANIDNLTTIDEMNQYILDCGCNKFLWPFTDKKRNCTNVKKNINVKREEEERLSQVNYEENVYPEMKRMETAAYEKEALLKNSRSNLNASYPFADNGGSRGKRRTKKYLNKSRKNK